MCEMLSVVVILGLRRNANRRSRQSLRRLIGAERTASALAVDVDVCVSVAGVVDTFAPAHSMSAEKWSRDIDVNLTGAFRVIQACLPGMRERRFGRIVAMSSMAGQMGSAGK